MPVNEAKEAVVRLDEIFWQELPQMECYRILKEIRPIGGKAKVESILLSLEITGKIPEDTIYTGDSITDVEALRFVKKKGGLAISFNANRYALRESDIAILSDHTIATSILADCFDKHRKPGVLDLVENYWNPKGFRKFDIDSLLIDQFEKLSFRFQLDVAVISDSNREALVRDSEIVRKRTRGAAGELG